jgi:hypothetical protein
VYFWCLSSKYIRVYAFLLLFFFCNGPPSLTKYEDGVAMVERLGTTGVDKKPTWSYITLLVPYHPTGNQIHAQTCQLEACSPMLAHCFLPNLCLAPRCLFAYQNSCMFSMVSCFRDAYKYSLQCCEIQYTKMKCSVEQELFIYNTSVQCSLWRKCNRKFCKKYPDSIELCKAMLYNTVTKLHSSGLVLDKK